MRSSSFLAVAFVLVCCSACADERGRTLVSSQAPALPVPTTPPAGDRDERAIVAVIIEHAWEVVGSSLWAPGEGPPGANHPSEAFVDTVHETCTFHRVDLNADGEVELIVDVGYQAGATGNRCLYVLQHGGDGWAVIGELFGRT